MLATKHLFAMTFVMGGDCMKSKSKETNFGLFEFTLDTKYLRYLSFLQILI
jgi:hypothetical protein